MSEMLMKIFDSDGGDYSFTMSHIAISGVDTLFEYDTINQEWVLQQDGWVTRDPSHVGVVLKMIALRFGLHASFWEVENAE